MPSGAPGRPALLLLGGGQRHVSREGRATLHAARGRGWRGAGWGEGGAGVRSRRPVPPSFSGTGAPPHGRVSGPPHLPSPPGVPPPPTPRAPPAGSWEPRTTFPEGAAGSLRWRAGPGACRPFRRPRRRRVGGARPSYSQGAVLRGARSQRLPPEGAVELGLTLRPRQLGWGPGEGAACLPNNLPGDELLAGPGPHSKKQGLGQTHGARKVLEDEGAAWSLWQPCRGSVQTLGVLGNNRTTFFRKPLFSSGVSMLRATAPVPR